MDFKSKLATLARPAPSDASLPKPPGKVETLLELRQKMAEILAGSATASQSPRESVEVPNLGELLPFQREERSSGPLFRRHQILPPSHHVGRMPGDAAASSRAELLGLLALDPRRALYFDTETTGLGGGAGVLAFLIGIAWFDDQLRLHAEQFLLRSPGEEAPLLEAFAERLQACELLVSYNGKAFDLPLLNGRMVMNRRPKLP